MQARSWSTRSSGTLAALRAEEDRSRARLQVVRSRLAACVALARELPELERRVETERGQGAYRSPDLAQRLQEARQARADRAALRIEEASLMTEMEALRARLEGEGIRHVALPILENVAIASPCSVSWADMQGDSDTRFCEQCEKHVHNLSMMSRQEAEAVIAAAQGREICVRLYRREDGTVLTDDCPVGVRHRYWRRTSGIAAAGLLLAALGLAAYTQLACSVHVQSGAATSGALAQ
jgi:hypothetical protein